MLRPQVSVYLWSCISEWIACRIFVKIDARVIYEKTVNKLEFCDNRLIFGHTLIKGIDGFLPVLSICLDRSEWNSELKISTLCRWAFGCFVKINVWKMYFTYGRKWNITHIFYIFPMLSIQREDLMRMSWLVPNLNTISVVIKLQFSLALVLGYFRFISAF